MKINAKKCKDIAIKVKEEREKQTKKDETKNETETLLNCILEKIENEARKGLMETDIKIKTCDTKINISEILDKLYELQFEIDLTNWKYFNILTIKW